MWMDGYNEQNEESSTISFGLIVIYWVNQSNLLLLLNAERALIPITWISSQSAFGNVHYSNVQPFSAPNTLLPYVVCSMQCDHNTERTLLNLIYCCKYAKYLGFEPIQKKRKKTMKIGQRNRFLLLMCSCCDFFFVFRFFFCTSWNASIGNELHPIDLRGSTDFVFILYFILILVPFIIPYSRKIVKRVGSSIIYSKQ